MLHPSVATKAPVSAGGKPGVNAWARTPVAGILRRVLRALLLFPLVRHWCRPARIEGRERIPAGTVLFVANHASHTDTALILASLPRKHRHRTAPAAAADYFFCNRFVGALSALVIGAFAFPRHGREGLRRARALMDRGWSVLMFPEGTRSVDGAIGEFKRGAAVLAAGGGATVVPVGLAGTREAFGKKKNIPTRAPVAVVFGDPIVIDDGGDIEQVLTMMRQRVATHAARAEEIRPAAKPALLARVQKVATSPAGIALAFAWGVAEATVWPIVPDLLVATLALASPRRAWKIAIAAIAGSMAGGGIAYAAGATPVAGSILDHMPFVTRRMQSSAMQRMTDHGGAGILSQPWSGIPFKVFGIQAQRAHVNIGDFLWHSLIARGSRIAEVAAGFALLGAALTRIRHRVFGILVASYTVIFSIGLAEVVAAWS